MNKKFKGVTKKPSSSTTTKVSSSNKNKSVKTLRHKKIDLTALDTSFSELHQTKLTQRKASKILQVPSKLKVPSREIVNKTGEDLSRLLEDF